MSRFVKIGLVASTMLALAAPALAEPGHDRGEGGREWRGGGGGRGGQPGGGGNGGGQRSWSAPAPTQQQAAPVREQRAAPTVQNAPVPPSAAPAPAQWRQQRDGNTPRPGAGNWQGGRDWNRDRTPPAANAPSQPQPQQEQRNWTRNNGTPGQRDWTREGRPDRPDGRDNGNWNRGNNNWQQDNRQREEARNNNWQRPQQGYNYQRRLQDRDRWADTRRWDNNWRSNNRYDWQRYRSLNRSFYHLPAYYAPYGWSRGYTRFSIGFYLSNVLFASDYWIDDPYDYRLPPAYGPLRWVRYYDDALLVDIRDGYVVDVIHDFFW